MIKKHDDIIDWCIYCKCDIKCTDNYHYINNQIYCDFCYKVLTRQYTKTIHYDDESNTDRF